MLKLYPRVSRSFAPLLMAFEIKPRALFVKFVWLWPRGMTHAHSALCNFGPLFIYLPRIIMNLVPRISQTVRKWVFSVIY